MSTHKAKIVRFSDMHDRFKDTIDDEDQLIYMVEFFATHDATTIIPGKVGDEFYRTKGHMHVNGEYEMYRGIEGKGKIVQIRQDGSVYEKPLGPDDRCDIEPYAYHYAVNTGDEPFVFNTIFGNDVEKDYTMRG